MSVAARVLTGLGPALRRRGGPLLTPLVTALLSTLEEPDQLLRGTSGRGPFVDLLDLETTPVPEWVGSASGTSVPGGLTLEQRRDYVRTRPAQRRGGPAALRAAVRATLVGSQRVELLERTPDPDHVLLLTYASETPAPAATLAAALSQKPVGLLLEHQVVSGASVAHMRDEHGPTVADYAAAFATVGDARDHTPEETGA